MKIQGKVILDDHRVYNIPNDILVEILLRLPAKSLLRFRWACKYWFDLISSRDSSFVKMHLHHSTITTNNNNDEILMRRSVSNSSCYIVLSISERNVVDDSYKLVQRSLDYNDATGVGDVSSEVSVALPFDRPAGCGLEILGSCNGLILLYQYPNEIFCIWNPCTKEYKILPPLPDVNGLLKNTAEYQRRCYGFGYDHITDDYKVIIRNMYCTFGSSFPGYTIYSEVQVYTLGTNSWRKVVDGGPNPGKSFMYYKSEGLFVNGAIYWINLMYRDVVSFDIVKEKFQHVSRIPNLTDSWICMKVFEGSMCLVINDQLDTQQQIWVMKQEYAVNNDNDNESLWTKLLAIPHLGDNCDMFPLIPLRFTRNGEILMVNDDNYLCLYDPKNSNVETICRICEHPNQCYFTYVYTESLVSLNSRTYMGRERMKQANKKKKNQTKNKDL